MIGNRTFIDETTVASMLARGYVVASPDVRLTHQAIFPAQIRDVKTAVCWLRTRGADEGLDARRIALWGISSGGHLAALAGTAAGAPEFAAEGCGAVDDSVQAVVDFYGPTDLLAMDEQSDGESPINHASPLSPTSLLVGGPLYERRELAELANPVRWASPGDAPFFIAHGDADWLVPVEQSRMLERALAHHGVEVHLEIVAGGGHGQRKGVFTADRVARALDFVDRHLGRPGPAPRADESAEEAASTDAERKAAATETPVAAASSPHKS
jgi:acetyl esterase/lipase